MSLLTAIVVGLLVVVPVIAPALWLLYIGYRDDKVIAQLARSGRSKQEAVTWLLENGRGREGKLIRDLDLKWRRLTGLDR